jgi:hypothetical protein
MQSPSAEWVLGLSYLGVLDYMRARGEADGDTLSEVTRDLIYRHPLGRVAFTIIYAAGAVALHRHLVKEVN